MEPDEYLELKAIVHAEVAPISEKMAAIDRRLDAILDVCRTTMAIAMGREAVKRINGNGSLSDER